MPSAEEKREQETRQIHLVQEAFDEGVVVAYPENWEETGEEVQYLYRKNKFIVRDSNLGRVIDYLDNGRGTRVPNRVDPEDPELAGATVLTVDDEDSWSARSDILNEIDRLEGHGAMGYDHLSYVCVHCCAAIEPEEVGANAGPEPAPQDVTRPGEHGAGVEVRVVDTGLITDPVHPWMLGVEGDPDKAVVDAIAAGRSLPQDGGHGTFTAGCVRLSAPEAVVRVANALVAAPGREGGSGAALGAAGIGAVFESNLAAHLRSQLVADEGADPIPVPDILVVNFAGTTRSGRPPVALAALYDSLIQHLKEVLILAPAGNEGDERKNWPASFAWVVSVGALDEEGNLAEWSNRGRNVDVYAPGDNLVNAYATGDYDTKWTTQSERRTFEGMARWSGTSFATPLVAGLVAARMSSTGQSSRRAWESLLNAAEQQRVQDAGPALFPG